MIICAPILIVVFLQVCVTESRSFPDDRRQEPSVVLLNVKAFNLHNLSDEISISTWTGIVYQHIGGWVLTTAHDFAPFIHITRCVDVSVCAFHDIGFSLTITFPGAGEYVSEDTIIVKTGEIMGPDENVFFHHQVDACVDDFYDSGKYLEGNVVENLKNYLISNSNDIVLIESKSPLSSSRLRLRSPEQIGSIDSHCFAVSMSKKSDYFIWDYNHVIVSCGSASDPSPATALRSDALCVLVTRPKDDDVKYKKQGCQDVYMGPLLCVNDKSRMNVVGLAKSCTSNGTHSDRVQYSSMNVEDLEGWIASIMWDKGYIMLFLKTLHLHQITLAVVFSATLLFQEFLRDWHKCLLSYNLPNF